MAGAAAHQEQVRTGAELGTIDAAGGGNFAQSVDRNVGSNVTERMQTIGRSEGQGGPVHSEFTGRQQGEQSYGSALQDKRMAEAMGVSQQELGEFRQHGVITDGIAPAIGKNFNLDAQQSRERLSGKKINPHDLSVNQDTGQLMTTRAEMQGPDGSEVWGQGMVTNSGTKNGQQLLDKADELDKHGTSESHEAAANMRSLVGRGVTSSDGKHHGTAAKGRGLSSNETAEYMEKQSYDGKTAEISVRRGNDVKQFNTSSDTQGRTKEYGDRTKIGNKTDIGNELVKGDRTQIGNRRDEGDHTTEGSTYTESQGDKYDPQTAWQQALKADPMLFKRITEPGITPQEREVRMQAVASAMSEGMKLAGVARSGSSSDFSRAEGSGGAHIPGTNIGGSAAAGYQSFDTYDVNLGTKKHMEALEWAWKTVSSNPGITRVQATATIAGAGQKSAQEENDYFKEHGTSSYGASALPSRGVDAAKKVFGIREAERPDVSKAGVDGISGNPSHDGEKRVGGNTRDQIQTPGSAERGSSSEHPEAKGHQDSTHVERTERLDQPGHHQEAASRGDSSHHVEQHGGTNVTEQVRALGRTERSGGPEHSEAKSHQDGAHVDRAERLDHPGHHQVATEVQSHHAHQEEAAKGHVAPESMQANPQMFEAGGSSREGAQHREVSAGTEQGNGHAAGGKKQSDTVKQGSDGAKGD